MAGDVRSLTVKWLGDASNLVQSSKKAAGAVGNAGKEITGHGNKISGVFGSLGKIMGNFNLPFSGAVKDVGQDFAKMEGSGAGLGAAVAAGAGVAGAAMVEFGRESVDAAEGFNKAHERLGVVVENTGAAIDGWEGKVRGADKSMAALGFTETDTESSLARLVPVTKNVGKATDLMGLAADVARARGSSLEEATGLLVQVEAGRMRGLVKLGIATKDVNGKTISSTEAIQKITDLFGGAASKYADTYAGKLAILKAESDRVKVAVGNELIPALSEAASAAVPVAEAWANASEHLSSLHIGLGDLGHAIAGTIPGLNVIGAATDLFGHKSSKAADDTKALSSAQKAYAEDLAKGTQNTKEGIKHRNELSDASEKAKLISDGLAAATNAEAGATKDNTKAVEAAKKAAEDRAKAEKTETDAIIGTHDATIALSNSTLGVADSLDTYNEKALIAAGAGGKNASANRDWESASNAVKSSIDGVASSAEAAATQQAALHNKTLDARDAARAQRDALVKLRDTIGPNSPFRSYLDQLIGQLDQAAKPRSAQLSLKVVTTTPSGQVTLDPRSGVVRAAYGYAEGGYVPGPIGAPVLATVHGGEYVTRAQDVGRGGGGSTNNYAITVNVAVGADPAAAGKAVVDAIRAYEKRNGASWRKNVA